MAPFLRQSEVSRWETGSMEIPRRGSDVEEEDRRVRILRRLVDFSLAYIAQSSIPLDQAHAVVEGVKRYALRLFPDKEATFDLIYLPRFRRLLQEKYRLH
jgi:hypothetical protein